MSAATKYLLQSFAQPSFKFASIRRMSQLFANIPLKRKGGADASAADLQNKVVALYFSAHWCGPCRNFTPILKDFYDELAGTKELEIVFVSFDRTAADLDKYLSEAHGNWLYIPYGDKNIETLSEKYGVSGIPSLIVIKPDGEVITKEGRADVQGKPPKATLSKWKAH
uniref:Thioredoxin domain-containing protein n=1 Tax=Panagrolaimus sp. JU765 TaxID=591449 RepID=A0AC34QPS1_9BILA